MTQADREKVISHAHDHIAYGWTKGLPLRHIAATGPRKR